LDINHIHDLGFNFRTSDFARIRMSRLLTIITIILVGIVIAKVLGGFIGC